MRRIVLAPRQVDDRPDALARRAAARRRVSGDRPRARRAGRGRRSVSWCSPTNTATRSTVSGASSSASVRRGLSCGEDEADEVGACLDRGVDVLLPRQPAHLHERPLRAARAASRPGRRRASAPSRRARRSRPRARLRRPGRASRCPTPAITIRSRGACATSSSCAARSTSNVERSRALMPITGASSATARASSAASCASTSVSRPSCCGDAQQVAARARRRGRAAAAAPRRRRPRAPSAGAPAWRRSLSRAAATIVAAARRAQVVPGAAEPLVDEHRHRARAGLFVCAGDGCDVAAGAQVAGRRRASLELGDRAERAAASASANLTPGPLENATSCSSRSAAAPESSASRASSRPSRRSAAWPPAAIAPAAFSRIADRRPPFPPRNTSRIALRVLRRRAAAELRRGAARDAEVERVDLAPAHGRRRRPRTTRFGPAGESSSMPPAPCTTNARRAPSCASTSAITGTSSGEYTPTTWARAPAGFVSGPSTLKTVRAASSRRTGAAWRIAGWCVGANMKPKPSSSIDCAIRSGARSRLKPSASSTSADPDCDDTERLPCFATPAPAAAATSAAAVEMLKVLPPSPPVPAVSTRSSRFGAYGHDVRRASPPRARDLVGGLALQPQRDEEAADLRGRRLAGHDRVHHRARLGARQVVAVEQPCERVLDHVVDPSRKLRAMSRPSGVSTDSGWNCTPSIGSSRWRTAITSPSAAVADTSKQSGTEVAASEW